VVIRFRGDQICEMRDYTDSHLYEEFLLRHRNSLPKFALAPSPDGSHVLGPQQSQSPTFREGDQL